MITKNTDVEGNSIYVVDTNKDITLATANTYVDKNIIIKIPAEKIPEGGRQGQILSMGADNTLTWIDPTEAGESYNDAEIRGLIGTNTASINNLETTIKQLHNYDDTALIQRIENNESNIQTNSTNIGTNITNIQTNSAEIEALKSTKQDTLIAGKDINITNNIISVNTEWNITEFDTNYMKSHDYVGIEAPQGYLIDKILFTVYWYGNAAAVSQTIYGGFYKGKNTESSMAQVIRNNGTNKMGAGWITAEINNINDSVAIAFGEAYLYNNNGSAASLLQPVNSYGIGRVATQNNFKYFSFSNWPSEIVEGYAVMKYTLKKEQ